MKRLLFLYPPLAAVIVWLFIMPSSVTTYDGYYPTPPVAVNLGGPYERATYYTLGVSTSAPPPVGNQYIRNATAAEWNIDGPVPPSLTPQQAQELQASWAISKTIANQYTSQDTSTLMLFRPTNASGTSSGMIETLAAIDALTPGTLGHNITGTGTINQDGSIGPIGGLNAKLVSVADAHIGTTTVLVPASNQWQAPDGVTVVPVATIHDALTYLCNHGATDTVCQTLAQ